MTTFFDDDIDDPVDDGINRANEISDAYWMEFQHMHCHNEGCRHSTPDHGQRSYLRDEPGARRYISQNDPVPPTHTHPLVQILVQTFAQLVFPSITQTTQIINRRTHHSESRSTNSSVNHTDRTKHRPKFGKFRRGNR